MSSNPYNLDEGVAEYFQFILKGHLYNFRYPATGEMQELESIKDQEGVKKLLSKYITKADDKSPEFSEVVDQMTVPHWKLFMNMVTKEMGVNEENSSPKAS